ncbi:MAG: orotate phosphoribosyltransferase, partial [Bacteroidota bacterium]|nr:orotate phosphoribosyltransferase [Bacteroidota bacterium]
IAWGAMVADQLILPYVYVRAKPKEHGTGKQIEGYFEAKQKVVIVEDLISTGKSSLAVVDVVKKAGLEVMGMVSIFTYSFTHAAKAFDEAGVKLLSLTNYPALIQLVLDKGMVERNVENILLQWRENPGEWNGTLSSY